VLVLNQVSFGGTKEFIHGNGLEKVLKNAIPAKGVQLGRFKLTRPTLQTFEAPPGKSQLVAEFKVIGGKVANHPLVKPAFYREFRCVIRGESGVEYVTEFWGGKFLTYSDGYYGYIIASRFPRDSRWLWLLIERRESSDQGGPWKSVAEFKIENTVEIATNRLDLAVKFISAQDESGKNIDASTGSWGQYGFWQRIELPSKSEEVQATIAVVPNLHISFFAQPRLIVGGSKN
jgi:hypothetical protein